MNMSPGTAVGRHCGQNAGTAAGMPAFTGREPTVRTADIKTGPVARVDMPTARSLTELLPVVADYTLGMNFEEFIQGERPMVIRGLLATADEHHTEIAETYIDRAVRSQSSAGQLAYGSIDVVPEWDEHRVFRPVPDAGAFGYLVLDAYETGGSERYLEAARRQFENFHEDAPRTEAGGISHHIDDNELWIDAVYMMCPFMARYGDLTDTPAAIDEAVRQVLVHHDHLVDPRSDLYRHIWRETPDSYPDGSLWLRGNGWMAAGILDTLRYVPEDHDDRDRLAEIVTTHLESIAEYQDRSGFWHHLVDDPTMYLETSGTMQYAYSFTEAVERGLLDEAYREVGEKAMSAAKTAVTSDGAVQRNAAMPGGPEAPQAVNLYGQGWFLIAGTRLRNAGTGA
jgi:unsaturated rhamnogalacturonyl hydrolase